MCEIIAAQKYSIPDTNITPSDQTFIQAIVGSGAGLAYDAAFLPNKTPYITTLNSISNSGTNLGKVFIAVGLTGSSIISETKTIGELSNLSPVSEVRKSVIPKASSSPIPESISR